MAWSAKETIASALSVAGTEVFSKAVTLSADKTAHVRVVADFPGPATDDLIVSVYSSIDDKARAISAIVAVGGTGYTVGDVITLVGGVFDTAATFRVATAPGGIVGTVTLVEEGDYREVPTNPVAVTGGTGGDDCTLTVTWHAQAWDATPVGQFTVDHDVDPNSVSFVLRDYFQVRLGFVRDGATDTIDVTAEVRIFDRSA